MIGNNNFNLHKVYKPGKLLGIHKWTFAKFAKKFVEKLDVDIVFTNGNVGFGDVIRLGGLPYQRRQELMEKEGIKSSFLRKLSFKKKISHTLEKQSVLNPDLKKIIAVSNLVKDEFLNYYENLNENKFEVIANGLSYKTFDREEYFKNRIQMRSKYSIKEETSVILFVGNNFKLKGLHKCFKLLKKVKNSCLVVVGRDNTTVPAELQDRVLFTGWHENVRPFYDMADYFCLPSLADGFGLVVLEAMARGCYILISKQVGAKDIIEDFEIGTTFSSIAEIMDIVKNRDYLSESFRQKRRNHARKFSKNHMVSKYLYIFSNYKEDAKMGSDLR